ncbi:MULTISPECIES: hypothetical protein [unclassified Streptomyces]|uniref:hypothetical protein n=1 Tax=unclassified Streptomyces TaxID=2593676 RepID=UPI001BEA37FB|nr:MULTISPECIES: hypothetical protein [unclassified Streptomyces]MBT2404579.1 hypothetical protein [Streptomyces sp. ISL-21]MBT2610461.1 hypothetical protein [Streptomyces sp. ISL-87]
MDQGIAAVLGAAVGFAGGLITAALTVWTTRWQVKRQAADAHWQWRRQQRREAYAGLLLAEEGARNALFTLDVQLASGVPSGDLVAPLNAVPPALRELDQAVARVTLEGPTPVRRAAIAVGQTYTEYHQALLVWARAQATHTADSAARSEAEDAKAVGHSAHIRFLRESITLLAALPTESQEDDL